MTDRIYIDELKAEALSDEQVMKLVDGKARVLIYSDLADYDDIDEALGEHLAIFLLYESRPDFGHWVCCFRNGNEIEFFDPYGIFPDEELKWISEDFRKVSGQKYPHLSYLLSESPYKLTYNNFKFQKQGSGINTCGRWSALRLVFRDLTLKRFKHLFYERHDDLSPDDIVSILTEDI